MEGKSRACTTKVSTSTDTSRRNPSWFTAGSEESRSPAKTEPMIRPATNTDDCVSQSPLTMAARSSYPCARCSKMRCTVNTS